MTLAPSNGSSTLVEVSPDVLDGWMRQGDTVLVDVREGFEHASEHIDGARNVALSTFDPARLRDECGGKRIVFHCRSGKRSAEAATRFRAGDEPIYHLTGGIEAWKASGRATHRAAAAPKIDVMRQVQMTAGSLVVIGVTLGLMASPWFLALSAFVGCGLIFAGASGWCGMAMILARMPWNRGAIKAACATR